MPTTIPAAMPITIAAATAIIIIGFIIIGFILFPKLNTYLYPFLALYFPVTTHKKWKLREIIAASWGEHTMFAIIMYGTKWHYKP